MSDPGGKRPVAGTRDYDCVGTVVRVKFAERRVQLVLQRGVEGVKDLRPAQRDYRHRSVVFDRDRFEFWHLHLRRDNLLANIF